MSEPVQVKVPDIGDFKDVEVIEVLVKAGDAVGAEDTLITLESDKASMDVPTTQAGTIHDVLVKVGDRVSEGTVIATLAPQAAVASTPAAAPAAGATATPAPTPAPAPAPVAATAPAGGVDKQCDVVVIGAGPGGYTAAFRAADLGLNTILVERYPTLGGVCLNVGCIPSKALLHAAEVLTAAREIVKHGITFGEPTIDIEKLGDFKNNVVGRLTKGLAGLAKQRKVDVVNGSARFTSANTRFTNRVQQCGFTVIHVTHNSHHWRT